ncbi:Low temperature viability protein-domain-containing protein [Lanmaoa asiatica]|nr:Low temperature viability protein-domain-containing protein [Lanmaoa asiatica]
MPQKSIFRQPGAKHFQLVHRSQRDPLIHDPDASQHVLKAFVRENDKKGKTRADLEAILAPEVIEHDVRANVGEAALYGIYFDDTEYDYMQHLRAVGTEKEGVESILIEAPQSEHKSKSKGKGKSNSADPLSLQDLPAEALPSKTEMPRNYETQEAVPSSIAGFQPDMDPHLRQALDALEDDAFVDGEAGDDLFAELVRDGERDGEEEVDYEFYEYGPPEAGSNEREEGGEDESWEARFAKFKKEKENTLPAPDFAEEVYSEGGDTVGNLPKLPVIGGKRRRKGTSDASGYSMSSSSMYRTETLLMLDERFDQLMAKEYGSDEDDLDNDELGATSTSSSSSSSSAPDLITSREDYAEMVDEFMDRYELLGRKLKLVLAGESGAEKLETLRRALGQDERVRVVSMGADDERELDDEELFKAYDANEKKNRWDCETILTTYSNLENHPRIIQARPSKPVPKIKLDSHMGLPSVANEGIEGGQMLDTSEEGEQVKRVVKQTISRSRDESKEGKKARKQAVKAERQARRADKKTMKEQFNFETKHQAQGLSNKANMSRIRKLHYLALSDELVRDDGVAAALLASAEHPQRGPGLTSFNPFSEEDENDQSSYALVTSIFSRMKSSFATPLAAVSPVLPPAGPQSVPNNDQRRPSATVVHNNHSSFSSRPSSEQRPISLKLVSSVPAPPLVSLTPVVFEAPSFGHDPDRSPSRGAHISPFYEVPDGGAIGTSIPGFPIQDDARSIRTSASLNKSASVSKVIRRIRGEGMSKINHPLILADHIQ